jgi:hypothetical protein
MTTELVRRFRCEACDIEFDSMEALIAHDVEQPMERYGAGVPQVIT